MRKRPLVAGVILYIVFLFVVLVIVPAWGERIFHWAEKEKAAKKQYGEILKAEGLITAMELSRSGYQAWFQIKNGDVCIVYLPKDTNLLPGMYVAIAGTITWPKAASNPGEWDGLQYARSEGFLFYCNAKSIQVLGEETRSWSRMLFSWRKGLSEKIKALWPETYSGFLISMLLGERNALPEEEQALLSDAGISHILAISGMHLVILSELLLRLLRRFQREKFARIITSVFLWLYVGLTGAAVATLRAAIMVTLRTLAYLWHREEDIPTLLAVTALILLMKRPLYLLHAGFCLSFGAILGLHYGQFWIMMLPGIPYRLRKILAPTLGVTLFTLPLSLWFFYQVSLWSFLLNLCVLPAMSLLFPAAILAIFFSSIHTALGYGFCILVQILLKTFRVGSELMVSSQQGYILGQPSFIKIMVYYAMLSTFWFIYAAPYRRGRSLKVCITGIMCALILFWKTTSWRVTFLNVGQGDCAIVEWKDTVIMVDAGPAYDTVVKPYLEQRGIRRIDLVILSHPDWDHMEGLTKLATDSDYVIKEFWQPAEQNEKNEQQLRLEEQLEVQGTLLRYLKAGDLFSKGDLAFHILSPEREYGEMNEDSLVVNMTIEGMDFLFTGDIDAVVEQELSGKWPQVEVLKTAHHGSDTSSSAMFLKETAPQLAIISCGEGNVYGHPHEAVLQRMEQSQIPYQITWQTGAVWIEKSKLGKVTAYTYKGGAMDEYDEGSLTWSN